MYVNMVQYSFQTLRPFDPIAIGLLRTQRL